jgi:GT2 family glycosyltransferase
VEDLHRRVQYLSTSGAALRVLAGVGLRGVGLFEAARRHRRLLSRVIPLPAPPAAAPAPSLPAAASAEGPRTPVLDAFVVARVLPGDTEDGALERLHQLGGRFHQVLCVRSSARNVQAAYMLASGGAQVTLLGRGHVLEGITVPGLVSAGDDLGDWLAARGGVLPPCDAVLLDAGSADDDLRLLQGRLSPSCAVLVNGPGGPPIPDGAGAAERVAGLTAIAPPAAWRDPAGPEYYAQKPWLPGPRKAMALPPTLPSGRPWPRISVVTAVLNQGAFLEETLRSVLGQDYPDLEYIVVDGGSGDETASILERYRDRLAHCLSGPDEGQADALDKGFALSTGGLMAWLNGDDRYPAGALWRAALAFDVYGADIVAGGCALAHGQAEVAAGVHHPALPIGQVVELPLDRLLDLEGSWTRGDFFYQPEVFWTREAWRRAGSRIARDLHYSMDYELWLRLAGSGARIVHVPDTLAVYRLHPAQKTSGAEPPYLPELRRVVSRYRAGRPAR